MDMMVTSGLLNARYYDPNIGRFISPDPAAVNPKVPMTFNRYAYAADNPYRYKDPNGKWFDGVEQVVGTMIGAADGYAEARAAGLSNDKSLEAAIAGGTMGFLASFGSALASGVAGKLGAGVVIRSVTHVTVGTGIRAAESKYTSGGWHFGRSLAQSLGTFGVGAVNTWGHSLSGLPMSGRLLIGSNIALGEGAVEGIIHNTAEAANKSSSAPQQSHSTSRTAHSSSSSHGESHDGSSHDHSHD